MCVCVCVFTIILREIKFECKLSVFKLTFFILVQEVCFSDSYKLQPNLVKNEITEMDHNVMHEIIYDIMRKTMCDDRLWSRNRLRSQE